MSMIASVLHLDRQAVKALRITDLYSLHRVAYSLYEDIRSDAEKQVSKSSGILFADQGGDFAGRRILLLADRAPAPCIDGKYGQVLSKSIPLDFLTHQHYRFNVIINPTRRDSASRKLLPVKGREAITQWFCEKAQSSWGFEVAPTQLQVARVQVQQFNDKKLHPITVAQAHLQGQLRVTDPTLLHKSFTQGIGRARTFGCGLLQLVPVLDNPFA